MPKTTEAQAKATKKYLSGRAEIKLWMTPEEKQRIQDKAAAASKSVNKYMIDCALYSDPIHEYNNEDTGKYNKDMTTSKPQPPAEIIKQGGNALIMWLIDNGYTDKEAVSFMSGK